MGRIEARPVLVKLLRAQPSQELIDAVSSIADEECMIQLGRIARTEPTLADAALDALEGTDHPRAEAIATAVRNLRPRSNPSAIEANRKAGVRTTPSARVAAVMPPARLVAAASRE
jgi:hypothetical protein